ncbi:hypothetical protein CQW23_22220 [Capsicum baccatum]|uniref:Uncharacterized protein n=1 Tax=Capsicum baccatum TaxID=33114 RepID=A0A2G2W084_CAPBA|nr:hypothetical protein CQW23_22220 [Capsicum baccatum]
MNGEPLRYRISNFVCRASIEKSRCISNFVSLLQPFSLPPSEENLKVLTAYARKWSRGRTHQIEARSMLVIIRDALDNLTEKQVLFSACQTLEVQEQARLAALAAAQLHQQNIENPGRATNPDDEDLGMRSY